MFTYSEVWDAVFADAMAPVCAMLLDHNSTEYIEAENKAVALAEQAAEHYANTAYDFSIDDIVRRARMA